MLAPFAITNSRPTNSSTGIRFFAKTKSTTAQITRKTVTLAILEMKAILVQIYPVQRVANPNRKASNPTKVLKRRKA